MKLLYLDCGMGAAGDMLTAALLELFPDREAVTAELNGLGLPGVTFQPRASEKCGILGTHMGVLVNGEEEGAFHHAHHEHSHSHSGLEQITHLIGHLNLSEKVRQDVLQVFTLIAKAESHVHGVEMEQIHFHEVGTMDALADVTAVCYLLDKLGADKIVASPVHVGSGKVCCAHGILPVPAPATAHLLRQVPVYGGSISGELCTPTGAALLKHFVSEFGPQPVMAVDAIGYGMGKKDFAAANCLRAMVGQTEEEPDAVVELSCNLDDMTGEELGFAMEQLLSAGALDVYTQPMGMKKNRPAVLLTVLCRAEQREQLVQALFANTTTLGIREAQMRRYTLHRRTRTEQTPWGPVTKKISTGYGVTREKIEYEDLARIARENNVSLLEIKNRLHL